MSLDLSAIRARLDALHFRSPLLNADGGILTDANNCCVSCGRCQFTAEKVDYGDPMDYPCVSCGKYVDGSHYCLQDCSASQAEDAYHAARRALTENAEADIAALLCEVDRLTAALSAVPGAG